MSSDNQYHGNAKDDILQLKQLKKKKSSIQTWFEMQLIQFSGANTFIAQILPDAELNLLFKIGATNFFFCLVALTGIGFVFFSFLDIWIAVLLLTIAGSLFAFCIRTSIGAGILNRKKQMLSVIIAKWIFISICLLASLTGFTLWIFSRQINILGKQPRYEKEYKNYLQKLSNTDSLYPNVSNSMLNFLREVHADKQPDQIDSLLSRRRQVVSSGMLSYYARVYPDSVKDSISITKEGGFNQDSYEELLRASFHVTAPSKTGQVYNMGGIAFDIDNLGNTRILQNLYDSIFIGQLQINTIFYAKNFSLYILKVNHGNHPFDQRDSIKIDFNASYQKYFLDEPLGTGAFLQIQAATDGWLHRVVNVYNSPLPFRERLHTLVNNIFPDKSRTGVLLFIILMALIYIVGFIKSNLDELRKSKYPVLVSLYTDLESTRIDSIEEGLTVNVSNTPRQSRKETAEKKQKNTSELLQSFGTKEYYFQLGEELEDEEDYDGALEKYAKGYEKFPEEYEFLKKRANVFLKKNDVNQSLEYLKQYNDQRNLATVQTNLKRNISINFFEMKNHAFYGDLYWPLNKQMNILLGKNGYGKSHLLSILIALIQNDIDKTKEYTKSDSTLQVLMNYAEGLPLTEKHKEMLYAESDPIKKESLLEDFIFQYNTIAFNALGVTSYFGKIPVLAISDARFIDKSANLVSRSGEAIDIRLDSAKHFLQQKPYGTVIENALYRVCQLYFEKGQPNEKMFVVSLIENIFFDLTGNRFSLEKISSTENTEYEVLVSTEGADRLPIQKVSQGTFSVISIILLIYNYLRARYPELSDSQVIYQQAIILIDEIDAHLHPSWQQKIINILRQTFPNIQFIITAHSPLVVAGCKSGEVAVMRKGEKGFEMQFFENDFIGYQPGELLRLIFEMESYDETYLKYNALIPFKKDLEADIATLEAKTSKSEEDQKKLNKLYDDVYYINAAAHRSEELKGSK